MAETDNHIGSVFGPAVQAGRIDHVSIGPVAHDSSDKLANLRSRQDAAKIYEKRLVSWLDCLGKVFVVLTLVPEVDGEIDDIDGKALQALRASLVGNPLIYRGRDQWRRVMARGAWLVADSSGDDGDILRRLACTLHRTGAGSIAVWVGLLGFNESVVKVSSVQVNQAITNGALFLAEHARDRTGARGDAVLRATIAPVSAETPVMFYTKLTEPPVATAVAPLDGLVELEPALVTAAQRLADMV